MRILIAFILILLASPCYAQVVGQGLLMQGVMIGSATAPTYSDVLFYWGCETTTAEKSGGDSTATAQSAAALDAALVKIGNKSCDFPTPYDRYEFTWSSGVLALTEGRVGFYFYLAAATNGTRYFSVSYDADNFIRLDTATDNTALRLTVEIAGTGAAISTATASVTLDSWIFVEIAWKLSTDYREIFIDGTSKISSTAAIGDTWAGDPTLVVIGESGGSATSDFHVDQVLISNDSTRDLNAIKDLTNFD